MLVAVVATLFLLATVSAATWPKELTGGARDALPSQDGTLWVDFQGITDERGGLLSPKRSGDVMSLTLEFRGEPGRIVTVDSFSIRSPAVRFSVTSELPAQVEIGERGFGILRLSTVIDVLYTGGHNPLQLRVVADGEEFNLTAWDLSRPRDVDGLIIGGGAVPVLALLIVGTRLLPRRLNRW